MSDGQTIHHEKRESLWSIIAICIAWRYSRARENGKLEIPPAQKLHILSSAHRTHGSAHLIIMYLFPQEFVPFFFEEVTIPNIIAACNKHFKKRAKGMSCDVLASERGQSCTKISQLPSLKLFHIRFVMTDDQMNSEGSSTAYSRYSGINSSPVRFGSKASTSMRADPIIVPHSTSAIGVKRKLESSFRAPVNKVPKSLGITTMMRFGQAITATETSKEIVEVSRFNINDVAWSPPVSVHFTIEKEKFAEGGFRAAYKATSKSSNFEGKTYIVKRLLPKTVELIGAVNETQEDHARKSIQMQALANNFAEQVAAKVEKDGNKNVFGKPFRYVDAFLRKVQRRNQIVIIEQFASGTFQKYVNNDGTISHNKDIERQRKAESLVHEHGYVNCDIPHAAHKVYKWILRQYSIICLFLVLKKAIICLFSCFN